MQISLIAAVDEQFGLGKNNALLCHLPADLQHFKTMTLGKPVVMGRKTFDAIGKVLPGRMNIVLSRHLSSVNNVMTVASIEAVLDLVQEASEVMIIGGAQVYAQFMPYAHRIYLTVIHHRFDADVFFPPLDQTLWTSSEGVEQLRDEKNKYDMTFYEYSRKNIKSV